MDWGLYLGLKIVSCVQRFGSKNWTGLESGAAVQGGFPGAQRSLGARVYRT